MENNNFKDLTLIKRTDIPLLTRDHINPIINPIPVPSIVDRRREEVIKEIQSQTAQKQKREYENYENLKITAENIVITNQKLETQIQQKDEDLQMQREMIHMLKQQLTGISRTLNELFTVQENSIENQKELNELAKEIYAQMILGKKIDWKAIALDKGIDVTLATIPAIIKLAYQYFQ